MLKNKADLLLDRKTTIEIDIRKRTFIDRLLKRPTTKVFHVNRACLSTLIYFSKLTLDISKPEETFDKGLPELIQTLLNDMPLAIRIMALLIEDTDKEPSRRLVKFLGKNLDTLDQKALMIVLLGHSRIDAFMTTTILIRKMSLLKTEELIAFEKKQEKTIGQTLEES